MRVLFCKILNLVSQSGPAQGTERISPRFYDIFISIIGFLPDRLLRFRYSQRSVTFYMETRFDWLSGWHFCLTRALILLHHRVFALDRLDTGFNWLFRDIYGFFSYRWRTDALRSLEVPTAGASANGEKEKTMSARFHLVAAGGRSRCHHFRYPWIGKLLIRISP